MKVVSFINMKGGVAKTTSAINVADALVRREDKRVLLVDIDPQFNATQCLVGPDEYIEKLKGGAHTIFNVIDDSQRTLVSAVGKGRKRKPPALGAIEPWPIKEDLDLVAGDLELYRLDVAAGQGRENRLKRYLEESRAHEKYDFVIIDTPPTPSAWMFSALLASEYYVVPVKPEPLSFTGIDLLRSVVERFCENHGKQLTCLGVVLTIAESNTIAYDMTTSYLDTNAFWRGKRFQNILPKRTQIAREQVNQRLILDLNDEASSRGLAGITQELLERIDD